MLPIVNQLFVVVLRNITINVIQFFSALKLGSLETFDYN